MDKHKAKEGPAEEEASESQQEANQEGDNGVVIPEDFQQDVHNVLKKAHSKHHLSHMKDRIYAKEDEMRQAEMNKKSKGKKGKGPDELTEGAPASLSE